VDQTTCDVPTHRSFAMRKLNVQACQAPRRNETFLKVYNCDYIKPPRPSRFARAMKQIYRPEYVLSHYVHYSTVTLDVARYFKDQSKGSSSDTLGDWKNATSEYEVFLDEVEEATLIHARSVLPHETIYRDEMCHSKSKHKCPLGFVCPNSTEWVDDKVRPGNPNPFLDEKGKYCNCWVNEGVEKLVPRLEREWRNHEAAAHRQN